MTIHTEIGINRKQRVFALLEDVTGELQFPSGSTSASMGFIRPAGDATINQKPDYTDSEEKRDTLDLLDRFQNAKPPGDFSIPMYLRPSGAIGNHPQADCMLQSIQGEAVSASVASVASSFSAASSTLVLTGITGGNKNFPHIGVITIGSEKIRYTNKVYSTKTATTATLTGCTRGYSATIATQHAVDDAVTLNSRFYRQKTDTPSFSLWVETDHFVQGLSGCGVSNTTFSVSNTGAVMINCTGQGMKMVWAGTDALATNAASGATLLSVSDADRYSTESRVYNSTQDDSGTAGYEITRVDSDGNQIAVSPAISSNWATADVIKGYLPIATVIGTPIESRYTDIYIDGIAGKFKNTDITFDTPKQYINDEVGTDYPESYVEDRRNITSSMNVYFRAKDASKFAEGYRGDEVNLRVEYGNNNEVDLFFKRTSVEVPDVSPTSPTVSLTIPWSALGTEGEDSAEIVFNA